MQANMLTSCSPGVADQRQQLLRPNNKQTNKKITYGRSSRRAEIAKGGTTQSHVAPGHTVWYPIAEET